SQRIKRAGPLAVVYTSTPSTPADRDAAFLDRYRVLFRTRLPFCGGASRLVLTNNRSEQASNLEEEFVMPRVAVRVGRFHWPENGIDDNACRTIGWEARGLVHHSVGWAVNLRGLINADEIDAATQQRRQLRQLP